MPQRFRALCLLVAFVVAPVCARAQAAHQTQNIIFVMTDGMRWQEIFRGADEALVDAAGDAAKVDELKRLYWRETPQARRETLLPFLWQTIARKGQIYGNRDLASDAYVTNGKNFSYPGYNETLCGSPTRASPATTISRMPT